jgi:hypothetical protein
VSARGALRDRLAAAVSLVAGRIFEPASAQPSTAFPFLVLRAGPEDPAESWADTVYPFEIWPYAAPVTSTFDDTPYVALDAVINQIRLALGNRFGYWYVDGDQPYVAMWVGGSGDDFEDPAWQNAITRAQRVEVASLAWLMENHQVLRALRVWTSETFPEYVTEPTEPVSDAHPWIFWRFSSTPVTGEPLTLDLDWQTAEVMGHVVAPSPGVRNRIVSDLVHALTASEFWPATISMEDGSNLQILSVRTNPDADPRVQGQITVEVQFIGTEIPDLSGPRFGRAVLYGPPSHTSMAPPFTAGNQPAATGALSHT